MVLLQYEATQSMAFNVEKEQYLFCVTPWKFMNSSVI